MRGRTMISRAGKASIRHALYMPGMVAQLTAGGRRLSNQELLQTKIYQENKAWAAKLKSDGYTVIDLGNPYPKKNGFSPFYAVEKQTIFSGDR